VLFRLEEGEAEVAEDETMAGQMTAAELRSTAAVDEPTQPHPSAATALAGAPADTTVVAPPDRARAPDTAPAPPRRRRRLRFRTLLKGLLVLALIAGVVAGLYALSRQVYFIGTNDAGLVTVYRGVPYELPLGIELYEQEYASGVPARAIPERRRDRVLDHEWRSRADAMDLLRALERGQLSG
jgi:PPM family protein phosphatase